MLNDALPEKKEYTSEQLKLLGRAYRLILSWPRKANGQVTSATNNYEITDPRGSSQHSRTNVASLPDTGQG